ncbi:hypothetical protein E4U56_006426 [Claviceps arundinis]|uniref:Uncharacterized protein n=1 Tax=Claviceps arundinis TaxID=1623583 RepID=A0A9P7MWJ4_9HYPO|nr:hypothetical protein E4U56_006426 [Claviceps arundinis]
MPWVDIDFILEAQQIWADKYARGRCYRHYEHDGWAIQELYEENVFARDRYMQHVRQHEAKTWKFDARACFEADYERALQFPPAIENMYKNNLWGSAEVHPDVRMPIDLITGPWDEQKKRLLFWLIRAGALMDQEETKTCCKVRLAGLDAAVISPEIPDPLILKCIVNPMMLIDLPPNAAHNRIVKMCRRIDRECETQDMTQVLRYLVRQLHNNQEMMLDDTLNHGVDISYLLEDEFLSELYNQLVDEGDMDIDFILEAQQIWADNFARGRCCRHYETSGLSIKKLYKTNVHARDRYMQHVRQHEEVTWKFDARACCEADYERALQFPPAADHLMKNSLWGSADIHPSMRPPVDLLTGSWDEEKKRRLFWFVRAGVVQLSKVIGYSKVRLAGPDAAMISPEKPDPLVIKCLMPTLLYKAALPPKAAHNRLVKLEMHMNQETALHRHGATPTTPQ